MEENSAIEFLRTLGNVIAHQTEFWSAIAGAVTGGLIAYVVQVKALREGRKQREEDHRRIQQAQGNSLIFKMVRIYSNFYHIHQYIEGCFEGAAHRELIGEPWQFLLPLANPPDSVHFSSDEMGMLLGLKNDDVFNLVVSMDVIHNSLNDAIKVLNTERRALTDRLMPGETEGAVVSGVIDKDQMLALRPRMIEVNMLIENIRVMAKRDFEESGEALDRLQEVLRDKLGVAYKLKSKMNLEGPPTPFSDPKQEAARAPEADTLRPPPRPVETTPAGAPGPAG